MTSITPHFGATFRALPTADGTYRGSDKYHLSEKEAEGIAGLLRVLHPSVTISVGKDPVERDGTGGDLFITTEAGNQKPVTIRHKSLAEKQILDILAKFGITLGSDYQLDKTEEERRQLITVLGTPGQAAFLTAAARLLDNRNFVSQLRSLFPDVDIQLTKDGKNRVIKTQTKEGTSDTQQMQAISTVQAILSQMGIKAHVSEDTESGTGEIRFTLD